MRHNLRLQRSILSMFLSKQEYKQVCSFEWSKKKIDRLFAKIL